MDLSYEDLGEQSIKPLWVGETALIIRRLAKHRERMAMIEQGLDPDERAKQHKERMAMIKQGMHPDRPEFEEGDLERDPELIER